MSQIEKINESDTTVIFGATKARLWSVVEQVAGEPVVDFHCSVEQQVQGFPGWAGDKLVPTIRYCTATGREDQAVLFVKRLHAGAHEAVHYRYLEQEKLPVVRLYGVLYGEQQQEILFLAYLEHIFNVIESDYITERYQFLRMLAKFHTLDLSPDYRTDLVMADVSSHLLADCVEVTLYRIWEQARLGRLGTRLAQLCRETQGQIPRLVQSAHVIRQKMMGMEPGISNGEFGMGVLPGSDEWRLFDLHSIALRPRFHDLAQLFGQPAGMRSVFGPSWRSEHDLATFYLNTLEEYGGSHVSLNELLEETATLWSAQAFKLDWWLELALTGEVIWTTDRKAGRRHCRQQLYKLLQALVGQNT